MKTRPLGRTAIMALGLLMAAPVPAAGSFFSATSCKLLESAVLLFENGEINENPLKPKDVEVEGSGRNTRVLAVSWQVSTYRPASTITGYFVHITHRDSGTYKEFERSDSYTTFTFNSCLDSGRYCTGDGQTFDFKVKLKNNCDGITDAYSDSVGFEPAPSYGTPIFH